MSLYREQQIEAGEGLIGLALSSSKGCELIIEHSLPEDFATPLRPLAEAIADLHREGAEPTVATLYAHVTAKGHISFTASYFAGLATSRAINPAHARGTIQRMRELGAADRLADCNTAIATRLASGTLQDGTIEAVQREMLAAVDGACTSEAASSVGIPETRSSVLDALDRAAAGEVLPMLPHGIPGLHDYVPGLEPGLVYLVAARSSHGKSLLAGEIVRHATRSHVAYLGRKARAVMVSLEMGAPMIYRRMLAAELNTPERFFLRPADSFSVEQWHKIRARLSSSEHDSGVLIAGSAGQPGRKIRTMTQIESFVRLAHHRNRCDLAVIDHVGLVEGPEKDLRRRTVDTMRRIQAMAQDLHIPVLVVVQINREGAKENEAPYLQQLAESSAIEQAADVALLLRRPLYGKDRTEMPSDYVPGIEPYEINVAKCRAGKTGRLRIAVDLPCYRFGSSTEELAATRVRAASPDQRMGRQPLPEDLKPQASDYVGSPQ